MKLLNKKTGEIKEFQEVLHEATKYHDYESLAKLNEEWEDYKESRMFYVVGCRGEVGSRFRTGEEYEKKFKEISNYFETKEEVEQAVEKLKAWKRLKDKGFRFNYWKCTGSISFTFDNYCGDGQPMSASDDLDLLFGGEE